MSVTLGYIDPNPLGNCNGICFWRRAFWANMQCGAIQWGWGLYLFIHSNCV